MTSSLTWKDLPRPLLLHRLSWLEVAIQPGHRCLKCNTEFKSHDAVETDDGFTLDCRCRGTRHADERHRPSRTAVKISD